MYTLEYELHFRESCEDEWPKRSNKTFVGKWVWEMWEILSWGKEFENFWGTQGKQIDSITMERRRSSEYIEEILKSKDEEIIFRNAVNFK